MNMQEKEKAYVEDKEEDVFHKVSPQEYYVFFGEKYEVDISSEFIC